MNWNDIFRLPEKALAGNRDLPKAVLARRVQLTDRGQKTLEKVFSVRHFATVQESTAGIPPRIDEERDVQRVIFLHCETSGYPKAYAEVAALLHGCFSDPTVVLLDGVNVCGISASLTRIGGSEEGAVVVDRIEGTGRFYAKDEAYGPFLDSLGFESLPRDDLHAFVSEIAWRIMRSRAIPALGPFPTCEEASRERFSELIGRLDFLNEEASELFWAQRSDGVSAGDAAEMRLRKNGIDEQIVAVVARIKDCCGIL